MNKNHSHCMAAPKSLATRGYAAGKPRNSVTSTKMLSSFSSWRKLVGLFAAIAVASLVETVPAAEQKPTIPIIVKDTTTYFWQIVLAGARKAGKDLNVTVPQLGAQSESDINGQISILEITANPDLRGVSASNLTMAQGAGQAIAENKVSDKKLVGFDSDDKTVKLLADGTIQALVVQDPFRMGYE